jgi:hypothetical protein
MNERSGAIIADSWLETGRTLSAQTADGRRTTDWTDDTDREMMLEFSSVTSALSVVKVLTLLIRGKSTHQETPGLS